MIRTLLSKDIWLYITKFLIKNDIASLMATCTQINKHLIKCPKLVIYNVPSFTEFWESVYECLTEDWSDDHCIFIDTIDRGVKSFVEFTDELVSAYPNMSELSFSQDYTWYADSKQIESDFCYFITKTNISYLKIQDSQSEFFHNLNWDNILNIMPPRSLYVIIFDQHNCDIFNNYPDYRDYLHKDCFQVKEMV